MASVPSPVSPSAEVSDELLRAQAGLAEDARQGAGRQGAVHGHHAAPPGLRVPVLAMAAPLGDVDEAGALEGGDGLLGGDDGEGSSHVSSLPDPASVPRDLDRRQAGMLTSMERTSARERAGGASASSSK